MSTQSHIDKVNLQPMIIPYPTHVGAPKIEPTNLTPFKKKGLEKVDKILKRKYEEVIRDAERLQKSFEINQEIYSSVYKFEPIIGEIYHLYEDNMGIKVLSMISPSEWNKTYLYSVVLNSDMLWERIE